MGVPLQFGEEAPSEPRRLSPTMSSRKLQALDFIKRYFMEWGHSPTLGELAAELGVSTKRAHDLVHQLAQQKMIEHMAGATRGIRLVDRGEELSEADVLLRLSAMGWTIGRGEKMVLPPENIVGASIVAGLTEKELPDLDFLPDTGEVGAGAAGASGTTRNRGAAHRGGESSNGARRSKGSEQARLG